jgi:hypothetical protein
MQNNVELAGVIRRFGKQFAEQETLSPGQTKALYNILHCRTAVLGGHEEACTCCGEVRYSYNSCGDRHCPKCQGTKQALWVEQLVQTTLPVKHYHIVFTVPHCLNKICLWDSSMFYKLLFRAVWATLHSFGYTHYGVESGAVAMLHTWGQNLWLHPHIHCLVPAVGYSLQGKWKHIGKNHRFLYPVRELGKTFKGKFLDSLQRYLRKHNQYTASFDSYIQEAYSKKWVVFSEASMAKSDHVVQYLGQYTHRVAISNHRIISVNDTQVTFIAKDYREKAAPKPVSLDGVEFLRRFCLHILPKGFVKVRRFGIYNATTKRNLELEFGNGTIETVKTKKKETVGEALKRLAGIDLSACPSCKAGTMVKIRKLPRIRSPGNHLPSLLKASFQF